MSEDKRQEVILRDERGNNIIEVNPDNIAKNLVAMTTRADIMTPEDKKFFIENTERWGMVQQNCHIWRTNTEKRSILSELPTTHLKFHQAILENKVFVDETVRLAKDAEIQKLDAEELYVDIENLKEEITDLEEQRNQYEEDSSEHKQISYRIRKKDIEIRKKTVELQEKAYQIQQSAIAMKYRVDELKDWKQFEDEMIEQMKSEGITDEEIWNKNSAQAMGYFYLFLTKFNAVKSSTDSGEVHNLTYLARFSVEEAIRSGNFENWVVRCDRTQIQSLVDLGYIGVKEENGKVQIIIPEQFRTKNEPN